MSLCDTLKQIETIVSSALDAIKEIEQMEGCGNGGGSIPNQGKFRPTIPAGASMIAGGSSACTFTAWAIDQADSVPVMVVANHCGLTPGFAQCTVVPTGYAWVQPSPMDGGTNEDHVATLSGLQSDIRDPNVDALVLIPEDIAEFTNQIVGLGTIDSKSYSTSAGQAIDLSGRTSGVQHGTVMYPDASVNIDYGPCGILTKDHCIVASILIQGGDSGSPATVVIDGKRCIVGQWNAGGTGLGVAMQIKYIEDKYDVDFDISKYAPPTQPPQTSAHLMISVDGGAAFAASQIGITASD